jgi:hypothetical protein
MIQVIKSRRMRWAGYVARMGDRRTAYSVSGGTWRNKDRLKDLGLDRSSRSWMEGDMN